VEPTHKDGKVRLRIVAAAVSVTVLATALIIVAPRYRTRPVWLVGAVIQRDADTRKQSPISDVDVTLSDDGNFAMTKSDLSGYFKLPVRPGTRRGQLITLQFRHPMYQPLDEQTVVGDKVYVIHMVPLHAAAEALPSRPDIKVVDLLVRYSIGAAAEVNVGSDVKTFQVANTGNVACEKDAPCSPDGKWKAAVASASMDAGQGNVFENARVFCIAGPCPFTTIESDDFSRGGQHIAVSVRDWSDTTTFMLQAEVFREQVSDIVRESYPVIFGETFNFSLPAAAEGQSLEAELDGMTITFPLGPSAELSWASCDIIFGKNHSKNYRCALKRGYRFR